jgi:hypothetical protein
MVLGGRRFFSTRSFILRSASMYWCVVAGLSCRNQMATTGHFGSRIARRFGRGGLGADLDQRTVLDHI